MSMRKASSDFVGVLFWSVAFFCYAIGWWLIPLLGVLGGASLGAAEPSPVYEYAKDPRAIWYSKETLPRVYEASGRLFGVGYNLAGSLDRTGSANNENPWLNTGGLDHVGGSVTIKRMLWIPPGQHITLHRKHKTVRGGPKNGLDFSHVFGVFPVGTVSAEFIYDGNRLFEMRARVKTRDGWLTEQEEYGVKPAGYVAVENCTDCHKDIGKHSFQLRDRTGRFDRDWYGTVRGLEPGGPIHWHPWDARGVWGQGSPMRIRADCQSFVRWAAR